MSRRNKGSLWGCPRFTNNCANHLHARKQNQNSDAWNLKRPKGVLFATDLPVRINHIHCTSASSVLETSRHSKLAWSDAKLQTHILVCVSSFRQAVKGGLRRWFGRHCRNASLALLLSDNRR